MFKEVRQRLSITHKQPSIELVDPPNGFSDQSHAMESKQVLQVAGQMAATE